VFFFNSLGTRHFACMLLIKPRGMPCLLPQSAEREPNRKSLRPNSNRATKENSVPPRKAGSFLPT
jgi:hypothetical protein